MNRAQLPTTLHMTDGTTVRLSRRRGKMSVERGRMSGDVLLVHERRKCVNGAVCECGCGSTTVRVVAQQRGLAQSLEARRWR